MTHSRKKFRGVFFSLSFPNAASQSGRAPPFDALIGCRRRHSRQRANERSATPDPTRLRFRVVRIASSPTHRLDWATPLANEMTQWHRHLHTTSQVGSRLPTQFNAQRRSLQNPIKQPPITMNVPTQNPVKPSNIHPNP